METTKQQQQQQKYWEMIQAFYSVVSLISCSIQWYECMDERWLWMAHKMPQSTIKPSVGLSVVAFRLIFPFIYLSIRFENMHADAECETECHIVKEM